MTLSALLAALVAPGLLNRAPAMPSAADAIAVTEVAYDSRRVAPGALFVALRGQKADGNEFAMAAAARGALAIVSESPAPAGVTAPWVVVPDARLALAVLADELWEHPSHELEVVGITGTNGKTTTAYLLRSILEAAGMKCGLLGTVVYSVGDRDREATRTTPEAPDVQRMFRQMVSNGCRAAVMEVSSHALSLKRVEAMRFAAGVFTNLTRDHLDFHGDMESYFAAKRRLFELLPPGRAAVINVDDPRGAALLPVARRAVTYAVRQQADVTPEPFELSLRGLTFVARTPRGRISVQSSMVGRPNLYNLLAAVATGVALDLPVAAIEAGVRDLSGVPGRFQVVSSPADDVSVVVDYAHTDDALKNLLETARALSTGRLITVFGAGGDRDRTKRPLMGAVAGRMSDVVVVTSDNPRSEDPDAIIAEVLRGLPGATPRNGSKTSREPGRGPEVLTIADRGEAVARAIELARPGDLVIVAGKGHEKTQVIGDREYPFDDVVVSGEALARRRSTSRAS
jgi:UDP-N-acetylmuramoyl-L-alanyl-D-glutamate--2,6-diaminopimelate ligase